MIPFLPFVATMAVLGVAGMLPATAAADQPAAGLLPVAVAPNPRPPRYDLARGMCLVAGRRLVDPNFSESVVLLLEYDAKGALGLIVNRPTEVRLTDLLPDVEELKESADIVYVGGPAVTDPPHNSRNRSEYRTSDVNTDDHVEMVDPALLLSTYGQP